MNFGQAIEALKEGKRVARNGWNGKGMWLVLIGATCWSVTIPLYPSSEPQPKIRRRPWIAMKAADDTFVPWLASQTDMLAEDWEVV